MKIERLNDNQFRCILTHEDLAKRQIDPRELAYGSEKTRSLFQDMVQEAIDSFGFCPEEMPLMIEAIPLPDSIVLIVSKVDNPDELDVRFSNFTEIDEEAYEEQDTGNSLEASVTTGILELLKKLWEARTASAGVGGEAQKAVPEVEIKNIIRIFRTDDLDMIFAAAADLKGFYEGRNFIYKDLADGEYYLVLHQGPHDIGQFNSVLNRVCAYMAPDRAVPGKAAYCAEHFKLILGDKALQELGNL